MTLQIKLRERFHSTWDIYDGKNRIATCDFESKENSGTASFDSTTWKFKHCTSPRLLDTTLV